MADVVPVEEPNAPVVRLREVVAAAAHGPGEGPKSAVYLPVRA